MLTYASITENTDSRYVEGYASYKVKLPTENAFQFRQPITIVWAIHVQAGGSAFQPSRVRHCTAKRRTSPSSEGKNLCPATRLLRHCAARIQQGWRSTTVMVHRRSDEIP